MLIGPYIQNIGPEFCVRGCDIARACKTRVLYSVYRTYLHTIYNILYDGDISCIVYTEWSDRSILKNIDLLLGLYTIYRPHHIKGMMSPSYIYIYIYIYMYVITPYECYIRFIITEPEGEVIINLI